ncbi:MAG: hypothetical protein ACRD8W_10955 [Nitrososphaeraceae archaeon]
MIIIKMSTENNSTSNVPTKMDWTSLINESVHTSGDVDVGDIEAVSRDFVVVKRGFVNIHYYYIPINKVEGWDGHVLWLKISEKEVRQNYERDQVPDPYSYYIKGYPYYTTAYYPALPLIPSRYIMPVYRLEAGRESVEASRIHQCDLCNTRFNTADELSDHVNAMH